MVDLEQFREAVECWLDAALPANDVEANRKAEAKRLLSIIDSAGKVEVLARGWFHRLPDGDYDIHDEASGAGKDCPDHQGQCRPRAGAAPDDGREGMSKFTPGPWSTYVAKWPDKIVIRSLFADGAERAQVAVTSAKNARLIAAAPDLLEALRDALCALECCGKDYPAASKARAAIAKATGGEV